MCTCILCTYIYIYYIFLVSTYLTNQRYKPESLYPRCRYSSDVRQLTSEDMAGSSSGVARDQRLREKDGDEAKSQDTHQKLCRDEVIKMYEEVPLVW